MKIPSRKTLRSELDPLGYGARVARAARLAHEGREHPDLARLLNDLVMGSVDEALLAMEMARASGNEALLVEGLTHSSCAVQFRAASLAGAHVRDEAALEQRLPELAPAVRRRLLKGIVLARREALAARLFPLVRSRHGDAEAALLLPMLDADTVGEHLPGLAHVCSAWPTLVRRHPEVVWNLLRESITSASEPYRRALFLVFRAPLQELLLVRADAVLALTHACAPPNELPSFLEKYLPHLIRQHPAAIAGLLLRPAYRGALKERWLRPGAAREARFFSPEHRLALARALADDPVTLARFLESFAPPERPALFVHAYEGAPPLVHPTRLLNTLPTATRDAEAARQLELREVRENKSQWFSTLASRHIEHARAPLMEAARASKAEDRAWALDLLVSCTALSRRGLDETLGALARLKNEQDPVRAAALEALANVPPSQFSAGQVPALQSLVTYVVEARDTSLQTQRAVQRLAFQQMRAHATAPGHPLFAFALETLRRLAAHSGALVLPPLERDLPRGTEHTLFEALRPLLRAAQERESHAFILALARSLGRRAWNVEPLQDLLANITRATPDMWAQEAIQLWLAPPRTRDARVRALLNRDESTITLPAVFLHVHRRRQEWLDPFLQARALRGRYSTGKTGWVPPATDGFLRWLPRQREHFLDVLLLIAGDTQRSDWERMRVVRILPGIPEVDTTTLAPFLTSPSVPLVEAALGALAALDRPEPALPLLMEHLDGDRARVAMYAVPRVARRVPPRVLNAALEAVLSRERLKVTVAKEALRLLGAFRTAHGLALLRRQWARPGLHRDVRIAMGHAARQWLDTPEAWELLEELARAPDPDMARSLLDASPMTLTPELRRRYLALLLQVSRHPDLDTRRRAFTALPAWAENEEEAVAREAAARVLDIAHGAEWTEALGALVGVMGEARAFEQVKTCVARLVSAEPSANATPERDVPERQRLLRLCGALEQRPRSERLELRPHLDAVAQELAREPTLWEQGVALRLAGLPWNDAADNVRTLLELAAHVDAEPYQALLLSGLMTQVLEAAKDECVPEVLLETAAGVQARWPLGAVALVARAGERLHWREDAAEALRALRRHPHAFVRSVALAVFTAPEG
ncbi:hypothetical protein [Melittangium boletus]|uniref:hypothetical protein n=1 Tax=Melittangium boletus TaxID=83453 RepID=UPI003DA1EC1D